MVPHEAPEVIARRVGPTDAGALVVVDGATGAGKTRLAGRVHEQLGRQGLRAQVLSTDLLVPGWEALSEGVSRTAVLLRALAAGREGRVLTWDWERMAPGGELSLGPLDGGVLVVEGSGALAAAAQDLAPLGVVRVLVEAPEALRHARIAARDSYAWDIEAWQVQEERQRARWQPEPAWWPDVLVRDA